MAYNIELLKSLMEAQNTGYDVVHRDGYADCFNIPLEMKGEYLLRFNDGFVHSGTRLECWAHAIKAAGQGDD